MAITLNGTTGITTPDITSEAGLTVDGVSFASGAPANTLVTTSGGNVGVGITPSAWSASYKALQVGATASLWSGASGELASVQSNAYFNGTNYIRQIDGYATGYGQSGGKHFWSIAGTSTAGSTISFTQAMTLDDGGNLLVGCTSLPSTGTTGTAFRIGVSIAGMGTWTNSSSSTSASDHAYFYNPNGLVGYIRTSGSATSYVTSSDYRLKENVVGVTGAAARVQQLNPVRFNFIADPDTTVDGFLAHEVQDVVPEAITGAKDAVETYTDDEGNEQTRPVYQGIDQSKLVPLLTAALQEALTKIETLEARVAALEAA